MLAAVRTEKHIQTPGCHLSLGLSDYALNSCEGNSSVYSLKTCSNSSRGCRILNVILTHSDTHYSVFCQRETLC